MELKDPITNATLTEEQLSAAKLPETPISPSDDENSSIITVRSNISNSNESSPLRLHLAVDADANENVANASEAQSGSTFGTFLTTVQRERVPIANLMDEVDQNMQTIVEVVNPLISGDGYANKIAVGRSNDYPSFDESEHQALIDAGTGAGEFDSYDVYNTASELSLSDRMKNVLQELVENERVKLNFSQSISESDNEDSDFGKNDTDDDENEPFSHDDDTDINININRTAITEENGNAVVITTFDKRPDIGGRGGDRVVVAGNTDNASANANVADDRKNANVFIYQNPNFLMADDEMDASTSQQITTVPHSERNEREQKLKEKLLSELNVQPSTITETVAIESTNVIDEKGAANVGAEEEEEEESSISVQEDIPSVPTTPTEVSSKSNSSNSNSAATGNSKRRKRKNKAKKK